jgi:hypothetical protein
VFWDLSQKPNKQVFKILLKLQLRLNQFAADPASIPAHLDPQVEAQFSESEQAMRVRYFK